MTNIKVIASKSTKPQFPRSLMIIFYWRNSLKQGKHKNSMFKMISPRKIISHNSVPLLTHNWWQPTDVSHKGCTCLLRDWAFAKDSLQDWDLGIKMATPRPWFSVFLILVLFKKFWTNRDVCFGLLSWWKTQRWTKARLYYFKCQHNLLSSLCHVPKQGFLCLKRQNSPTASCPLCHVELYSLPLKMSIHYFP